MINLGGQELNGGAGKREVLAVQGDVRDPQKCQGVIGT